MCIRDSLIPTIAAGTITLGIMNQIIRAFSEVTSSFQYLVRSWSTIIDLISVFKRLQAFEAAFKGEELSTIGGLRDQCIQIVQICENLSQEAAMEDDEEDPAVQDPIQDPAMEKK